MPTVVEEPSPAPAQKTSRAGRDLPAAIGVGAGLIIVLLVGLFLAPPVVAALAAAAAGVGVWEVCGSLARGGIKVPRAPAAAGAAVLPLAAFMGGSEALIIALILVCTVVILCRVFGRREGMVLSVMSSLFAVTWAGLLISLAVLLFQTPEGPSKVLLVILMAVGNDTFGYIAGVLWGKHPMAPRISPKKTWEGFAGSMLGSLVLGTALGALMLQTPWWHSTVLAFFLVIVSALGDFSESMVKRELGVKDMGDLLPGHGGVMDRIDSILFAIPVGYVVFELLSGISRLGQGA
ncbi:phosphatidate cytidylyltransferase [Kocuria sp. p3-SID1433]|uniref:phosphatidate cytidylyltransferase n=1 Tax=unclassified Kocuria TaxID=2649579 RepID=UPI0021A83236|nr:MULTISPECIES: phosphatidate cytidylyltransferase [unclassified Kocuria]MCT1602747.1 phosphatidate cytidylyltransferase [Kocuria sp. p3-SID1428]MCT2180777.1 phosphatidate cytidylyltransferase [Kocuria sp. p3-SID1433]